MTKDDLEKFVASLAIPEERKQVILAELTDHLASSREANADVEIDLGALRKSLEAIEPAFGTTRLRAMGRGLIASLLIAAALDLGGPRLGEPMGALLVIVIAIALSPPRLLELLRAELRAPRVPSFLGRGRPIGPALTYLATVWYLPFVFWISLIAARAYAGRFSLEVPLSAFAVMTAVLGLLLVEGVRARRSV